MIVARQRGRMVTVFHNRRWDGDFLTVRKVLPALGEVLLFEARWDRFRPAIKEGWREVPKPGAECSRSGTAHDRSDFALFGLPEAISADILAQRARARVDDYFDLTLHYGERRVCLRCSTLVAEPRPRFGVHGSAGSYVKHGLDPQEGAAEGRCGPAREGLRGRPPQRHADLRPDRTTTTWRPSAAIIFPSTKQSPRHSSTTFPPRRSRRRARRPLLIDLARRASELGQRLPVPAAN